MSRCWARCQKLSELLPDLHVIHQTGEKDYVDAQAAYLKTAISAEVSPFIDDMPGAFARADLLVCRSGASTRRGGYGCWASGDIHSAAHGALMIINARMPRLSPR